MLSERLRRAQDQNVQAEMELEALRQAKARLQQLLAQARGPLLRSISNTGDRPAEYDSASAATQCKLVRHSAAMRLRAMQEHPQNVCSSVCSLCRLGGTMRAMMGSEFRVSATFESVPHVQEREERAAEVAQLRSAGGGPQPVSVEAMVDVLSSDARQAPSAEADAALRDLQARPQAVRVPARHTMLYA